MPLPSRSRRKVQFPLLEEWIAVPAKQRAPDVLPKNTAVLVFLEEVLHQARLQLVLSGVRADPNNALAAVRSFATLEQEVDTVLRKRSGVKREPLPRLAPHQTMQLETGINHGAARQGAEVAFRLAVRPVVQSSDGGARPSN